MVLVRSGLKPCVAMWSFEGDRQWGGDADVLPDACFRKSNVSGVYCATCTNDGEGECYAWYRPVHNQARLTWRYPRIGCPVSERLFASAAFLSCLPAAVSKCLSLPEILA